MFSQSELEMCKKVKISVYNEFYLSNLMSVNIDREKSVPEKVESFIEQVKNPYLFKVDDMVVKVMYINEKDFSDALCAAFCND